MKAVTPLQESKLENVLLGLDEYANLVWAVEQPVEGRDVAAPERSAAQEPGNPTTAAPRRVGGVEDERRYAYVAGRDAMTHWHPYAIAEMLDDDGWPRRRFVQRRPSARA